MGLTRQKLSEAKLDLRTASTHKFPLIVTICNIFLIGFLFDLIPSGLHSDHRWCASFWTFFLATLFSFSGLRLNDPSQKLEFRGWKPPLLRETNWKLGTWWRWSTRCWRDIGDDGGHSLLRNWWTDFALIDELHWKRWQLNFGDFMNWCLRNWWHTQSVIGVSFSLSTLRWFENLLYQV